MVCSIIASCLDYCNAILQGTPLTIFDKLQNNLVNRIAGTIFIGRADSFPYFFSPLSLLSLSSFSLLFPFPFRPLEVGPLRLWNSLPSNLWQFDLTLHQFRRALKTYLFGRLRLQHQVTFVFSVLYKCFYLFTYLLTYLLPLPFLSLRSRLWNPAMGCGMHCKLHQSVLGQSLNWNRIWCILASKHANWWQQFQWIAGRAVGLQYAIKKHW